MGAAGRRATRIRMAIGDFSEYAEVKVNQQRRHYEEARNISTSARLSYPHQIRQSPGPSDAVHCSGDGGGIRSQGDAVERDGVASSVGAGGRAAHARDGHLGALARLSERVRLSEAAARETAAASQGSAAPIAHHRPRLLLLPLELRRLSEARLNLQQQRCRRRQAPSVA